MGAVLAELVVPLGVALAALALGVAVLWGLSRHGRARGAWGAVASHPERGLLLAGVALLIVAVVTYWANAARLDRVVLRARAEFATASNLLYGSPFTRVPLTVSLPAPEILTATVAFTDATQSYIVDPLSQLSSGVVEVRAGQSYRYSLYTAPSSLLMPTKAQVRLLWLDSSLRVLPSAWYDSPAWYVEFEGLGSFHTGVVQAPAGAAHLVLQVRNVSTPDPRDAFSVRQVALSEDGAYVEQHPNGALASLAFSFDWETAMGGPIHSKGMTQHDPAGATQHGLLMRQGADWLMQLFATDNISGTFYATGYNLLDGTTEGRKFSGDPTYKWANKKDGWDTDYWTQHPWYGDDPHGTVQTDPGWYFGDQTRRMVAAGHEIGVHTFGHIYVRGSNVDEMGTDFDEWLKVAQAVGVPAPTTFAFPWRSSNSLKCSMYDFLYDRGIRAVTRIYAGDLKDLYTVASVACYDAQGKQTSYDKLPVLPDFLLGVPSSIAGEEAGGQEIGLDEGLRVIDEALARRGTTSFWTHPEQLGDDPALGKTRQAWQGVVQRAAQERDAGSLWIGTVAEITAYQSALAKVTTRLDNGFLGLGGWKLTVTNDSGRELEGVTLTLPGDVRSASSGDTAIRTVQRPSANTVQLSQPGKPAFPARQLVIDKLKSGVTTISMEWAQGEEPQW